MYEGVVGVAQNAGIVTLRRLSEEERVEEAGLGDTEFVGEKGESGFWWRWIQKIGGLRGQVKVPRCSNLTWLNVESTGDAGDRRELDD